MLLNRNVYLRILVGLLSVSGLIFVFLFQHTELIRWSSQSGINNFLVNKAIRYFLNDLCMIGLIYAIFANRNYLIFSFYVQIAGVVLFLLPYFIIKINYPGYNGPLLSFLHRLIVNPLLMLLLIPAFFYQEKRS
jgi:exosortase F-associated protein